MRFFSDDLSLSKEDINHIANVLRLKTGDEITICDGKLTDYKCAITKISKPELAVEFDILGSSPNLSEPCVQITLFQGLPKSDKMDLIVQKCVELGVYRIVPVECSRSITKITDNRDKKIARWQNIAEAAAKQSGRGIVPEIASPISFDKAVGQMLSCDVALMPYELENVNSIKNALTPPSNISNIAIFIGPEGGISDEEIALAKSKDIQTVSLGKRILRCETAGFTALILILSTLGEYE
ncbi:MAG: 16S rRNA (uracil(1498)-N(3))-methyltransferase [Defluviitaleaceae bacterium]|nr:16S rRNA (uracil(1498)-N(3))-methyltransferase [Defluviitaleaceae bacterium]